MRRMQSRKLIVKKTVAILAGAIMLFAMTFSVFYIVAETGHHCEDKDCPICECLRLCKNIIQNGASSEKLECSPFLLILPVIIFTAYFTIDTPVSKRIRLND